MRLFSFLRACVILQVWSSSVFAVLNVGDTPGNACWKSSTATHCIDDHKGSVRVLLYGAGWCGPCNAELKELVPAMEAFAGKRVVFFSLSSGDFSGGQPSVQFLGEWSNKFGIGKAKASWLVLASPRDAGNLYFDRPSIPNVVILGVDGKIVFKGIAPGVKAIEAQVATALKGVK